MELSIAGNTADVPEVRDDAGISQIVYKYPNAASRPLLVWVSHPPECSIQDCVQLTHESHKAVDTIDQLWGAVKLYEIGAWQTLDMQWSLRRKIVRMAAFPSAGNSGHSVGPASRLSAEEKEVYLRSSNQIETTPSLRKLSEEIAAEKVRPADRAFRVYDWIASQFGYKWPPGERSIQATLDTRKGDCGSLSILFCSMCRALGVPARPLFGGWCAGGINSSHVWSEIWLEGKGWIPVDVSLGQALRSGRARGRSTSNSASWERFFGNAAGLYIAFSIDVDFPIAAARSINRHPSLTSRMVGRYVVGSQKFYWGYETPQNCIPYCQPGYPLYPEAKGVAIFDGFPRTGYWSTRAASLKWITPFEYLRRIFLLISFVFELAIIASAVMRFVMIAEVLIWIIVLLALCILLPTMRRTLSTRR